MPLIHGQKQNSKGNVKALSPVHPRRALPRWIGAAALLAAFALGVRSMPEAAGADDPAASRSFADHVDAPARHVLEAARAQRATLMRERLKEHDRRRQAEVSTFLQRKRAAQEAPPLPDPPELVTAIESHFPGLHPRLAAGGRP